MAISQLLVSLAVRSIQHIDTTEIHDENLRCSPVTEFISNQFNATLSSNRYEAALIADIYSDHRHDSFRKNTNPTQISFLTIGNYATPLKHYV